MGISRYDFMKAASALDGECDFDDMTEEEIEELLGSIPEGATQEEIRERYFAFHDDVKDRTLPVHRWSD